MLYIKNLTGDLQPIAVNFDPIAKVEYSSNGESNNINLTLPF